MSSRCAPHTRRHLDRSATSPMRCFSDSGHTCAAPRLRSLMSLPARLCSHSACRESIRTEAPQPQNSNVCRHSLRAARTTMLAARQSRKAPRGDQHKSQWTPVGPSPSANLELRPCALSRPTSNTGGRTEDGAPHIRARTHTRARARTHTHAKRGCATAHRDQTRMRDASPAPAQYS
jgi:hypothetical protein